MPMNQDVPISSEGAGQKRFVWPLTGLLTLESLESARWVDIFFMDGLEDR